jgi:quinol monooxygenase YgiN
MPAKPWVTFQQPDPAREYLALLSELPLLRFRDLGAFILYSGRIQGQLKRTPGVLGYSLLAHIQRKQFWTLSVWESESALQDFVVSPPHEQVMRSLRGKMGPTRFVRWTLCGSEVPPRWAHALTRR